MFSVVYSSPYKIFLAFGLALWLGICAISLLFDAKLWGIELPKPFKKPSILLIFSLLVFWAIRYLYALETPPQEMDMSTWMASAMTIANSPEPFWTLLNYSDGRPLTVFPLVILEWLGIESSFRMVEMFGVTIWCATFFIIGRLLTKQGILLLISIMLWLGSVWASSLIAYNSEIVGAFFMAIAIVCVSSDNNRKNAYEDSYIGRIIKSKILLGFWLGCFPLVKFQLAPMGLVLGFWQLYQLFINKNYRQMLLLMLGAILPITSVVLYFYNKNHFDYLINDYFSNYFIYSYTNEFSDMAHHHRFSLYNLFLFLTRASQSALFWCSLVVVCLGFIGFSLFKNHKTLFIRIVIWVATLYAILQAGNHFEHYLLLLIVPSLWLLVKSPRFIIVFLFLAISIQGLANTYIRYWLPPARNEVLINEIVEVTKNLTQSTEKIVIWGYTDEIFVNARRSMGYRSPYTFWVFHPSSQQQFRIQQFINDLEENKPRLFIDAYSTRLDDFEPSGHWQKLPPIKNYIERNYVLTKNIGEIQFWTRK